MGNNGGRGESKKWPWKAIIAGVLGLLVLQILVNEISESPFVNISLWISVPVVLACAGILIFWQIRDSAETEQEVTGPAFREAPAAEEETESYNIAAIRRLLTSAFAAGELQAFCQDRPVLEGVVSRFGPKYSLDDTVREVIDYCRTELLWDELLAAVKVAKPRQYARFEPELSAREGPGPIPMHPPGAVAVSPGVDPLDTFTVLLDEPDNWEKVRSDEYIRHRYQPQFVIRQGEVVTEDFREPWAQKFPDPHAYSFEVEYRCDSTLLNVSLFVAVDGGRFRIPAPQLIKVDPHGEDWDSIEFRISVSSLEWKTAMLFDQYGDGDLRDRLSRIGVKFVE